LDVCVTGTVIVRTPITALFIATYRKKKTRVRMTMEEQSKVYKRGVDYLVHVITD